MNTHKWHVHGRAHWSNVYFVELPNRDMKTQIFDIRKEKLIEYDVKEGDIISFPAMLCHSSPPNLSDERKTIIAFNTSFMDSGDL